MQHGSLLQTGINILQRVSTFIDKFKYHGNVAQTFYRIEIMKQGSYYNGYILINKLFPRFTNLFINSRIMMKIRIGPSCCFIAC